MLTKPMIVLVYNSVEPRTSEDLSIRVAGGSVFLSGSDRDAFDELFR